MTKFICETKNLSKKYKDFYALKNVNLTIPKGEIYGLVGENGAGKTTLIRLLTGLNFKSEGEIILFGHTDNLQYERTKIGWLTQNLNGYRIALLGGAWSIGSDAGGFYWTLNNGVGSRSRNIGGRLVYVPTVTV